MKASIIDAPGRMRVSDWSTPEPGAGEVLVRVHAAGICAGDMYIYLGKIPTPIIRELQVTNSAVQSRRSAPTCRALRKAALLLSSHSSRVESVTRAESENRIAARICASSV